MGSLRNYVIAMVGFVLLFTIIVFISPGVGQGKAPTPVEVVNTPTVNIGNTETNPVPVLNLNDARQPFQKRVSFNIEAGDTSVDAYIEIPEGKRLVIEHASARVQGPTGQKFIAQIQTRHSGQVGIYWLVFTYQGTFSSIDVLTANQPMRVYADQANFADPTIDVIYVVTRSDSTGTAFAEGTISGYLVDLP